MSTADLRKITNHFQDARLVSLAGWRQASEITPRDRGGPYVVLQEGYDPDDLNMTPGEFVLGRSGKWLSLAHFFRLGIPERRTEFLFGTAAEAMQIMADLPFKVAIMGRPSGEEQAVPAEANDEMAEAFKAAKEKGGK